MNKLMIFLMCLAMIGLAAACSSASATATAVPPSATPAVVAPTATAPAPTATSTAPVATATVPAATATLVSGAQPTVKLGSTTALGEFLVDAQGLTLYHFDDDKPNESNCTGSCADIWPPLTVPAGTTPVLAAGIPGTLGVITRADGSEQVTYNEMPLYRYSGDSKPGETNGEGLYGLWYVVPPVAAPTATTDPGYGAPAVPTATATVPASTATPVSGVQPTVELGGTAALGKFLVDAQGMTLYHFDDDKPNESNCTGSCADIWPPLTVPTGTMPSLAAGISGTLGIITRTNGSHQVTYNEMPLYHYSGDSKPGETNGEGLYGLWYVVPPAAAPTVELGGTAALGEFLVDAQGMTLYHFDDDKPNESNCTGSCADIWPPLTVPTGTVPSLVVGIPGTLGVITRTNGSHQVTYNEMPLYRYAGDTKPGDTNGEGLYGLWYVVPPAAAPTATAPAPTATSTAPVATATVPAATATLVSGAQPTVKLGSTTALGEFLVDAQGLTLYHFDDDKPNESTCTGSCADIWPPLTVPAGTTPVLAAGIPGTLGVITRADGSEQVTYNEMPLYRYSGDSKPGETNGEGLFNLWYVVPPKS